MAVPKHDAELVMSAFGKKVKRGEIEKNRAPEIKADEIIYGEKIGGGCFGSVYKGTCRGLTVAIKKLVKQDLDPKVMEDFRKEVDILTQMRHPNVVLFLGACTEPGKMAIVCELMHDSVFGILRKHKDLSILQRVKMAKDTAQGMTWLHGADPQILHRDLKPQNLLVDDHWNVKLCDFGLSQVKLQEQKIRDGKSIPGTPLWMSPEVLLGKDVDEKADVYSYGIVLWEIMSGNEPFAHHDSYGTFKKAITKENERPPIPEHMHPSLKQLMERCWHPDPSARPSFQEILPIIDSVLIDCLIDDPYANQFWKSHFLGKTHVPWGEFAKHFLAMLKLGAPNPKDQNLQCLHKILAEQNTDPNPSDSEMVRLEKFASIINWFGPIVLDHKGFSILDKMRVSMQKEWFHGDISKDAAEDLLAGQQKGTFLVRTSNTEKNAPFTISKVNKKGKINHQRIHKRPDGTFELTIKYPDGKTKVEESKDDLLVPFIRSVSSELYLQAPCPGSRYKSLFLQKNVEGYLSTDD